MGRDFRRLFTGTAVSALGSEISELALPLLAILTFHATAEQVGVLRAAQFLPFLLCTLYAGVLVDRMRRRPLMVAADLGRFVVLGAVPLLGWAGLHRMEPLYVLVFLAGVGTVVHQLADQAYLPTLVDRDRLLTANGRIAAAQSGAELSGQGIGGLLVAWLTAPVAVAVDALSYLVSAFAVAGIRTPEPKPVRHHATPLRRELFEGLRHLAGSRLLRPLVGEAATYNVAYQVFSLGLLLWLARDLRLSPVVIGVVLGLAAAGALAGALTGARLSARYGFGRTMLVTMAIGNSAPLLLFAAPGGGTGVAVLVGAVFIVAGFGTALANVHNRSLRQSAVPDEIRGRVTAAYRLVSWGTLPLGSLAGGFLATELGAYGACLAGAAGIAAATLWVALSPIPRLRETPAYV
ncbi:MFS transporter [Actinoplanes aureus]|uniref:MFS transporter n=1 Tax=Actinoplanes aureus TaxID=2792083 RepID=A0A931C1F9_9ACTN|nr:MFS transporter [Actinoplanes aureus]MBG0561549.1 MFS transporter [Actinoplanes aureus]